MTITRAAARGASAKTNTRGEQVLRREFLLS
jgi:hypothetical protein